MLEPVRGVWVPSVRDGHDPVSELRRWSLEILLMSGLGISMVSLGVAARGGRAVPSLDALAARRANSGAEDVDAMEKCRCRYDDKYGHKKREQ
jgi:hypothetical protein